MTTESQDRAKILSLSGTPLPPSGQQPEREKIPMPEGVTRVETIIIERITMTDGQQAIRLMPRVLMDGQYIQMPIDVMTAILSMANTQNCLGAMGMLKSEPVEP